MIPNQNRLHISSEHKIDIGMGRSGQYAYYTPVWTRYTRKLVRHKDLRIVEVADRWIK